MPCLIAQKLRAFRDLAFPDLQFEVRPVAMLEEQVRSLNLPSTPLKETEKRAGEWNARYPDLEQTEIDALATLQPDVLIEIAEAAVAPFFDADLAARQREAEEAWLAEARAAIANINRAQLSPFEVRLREEAQKVVPIASAFNAAADDWYDAARHWPMTWNLRNSSRSNQRPVPSWRRPRSYRAAWTAWRSSMPCVPA